MIKEKCMLLLLIIAVRKYWFLKHSTKKEKCMQKRIFFNT